MLRRLTLNWKTITLSVLVFVFSLAAFDMIVTGPGRLAKRKQTIHDAPPKLLRPSHSKEMGGEDERKALTALIKNDWTPKKRFRRGSSTATDPVIRKMVEDLIREQNEGRVEERASRIERPSWQGYIQ